MRHVHGLRIFGNDLQGAGSQNLGYGTGINAGVVGTDRVDAVELDVEVHDAVIVQATAVVFYIEVNVAKVERLGLQVVRRLPLFEFRASDVVYLRTLDIPSGKQKPFHVAHVVGGDGAEPVVPFAICIGLPDLLLVDARALVGDVERAGDTREGVVEDAQVVCRQVFRLDPFHEDLGQRGIFAEGIPSEILHRGRNPDRRNTCGIEGISTDAVGDVRNGDVAVATTRESGQFALSIVQASVEDTFIVEKLPLVGHPLDGYVYHIVAPDEHTTFYIRLVGKRYV